MDGSRRLNAFYLFLKILLIIACAEFAVMVIISFMDFEEGVAKFVSDSVMLALLSAPFLYYFVVRAVSQSVLKEARLEQEAMERELVNKALVEKVAFKQYSEDIVKSVSSSIMVVSRDLAVLSANPSSFAMLGKTSLIGENIGDALPVGALQEAVREVFETGEPRSNITIEFRRGEKTIFLHANLSVIHSTESEGDKRVVIVIDDITKRIEDEQTIFKMAYYDALTGLPNRLLLMDRLNQALAIARRRGSLVAVLFLDLDRFKFVNDSLGHDAGDELLKIVAQKLTKSLRTTDTVARSVQQAASTQAEIESVVGRLGGDEFVVLLPDMTADANVINVANRILAALDAPVNLNGHEIFISTSIGVSMFPYDGDNAQELLKKADMSMYWAKEDGRNNCKMYNPSLDLKRKDWLRLEYKLHKAIEQNEFVLYYQPQISAATGKIVGYECLIRWQDPETELIPPGRFIPIAEENGLIIPITALVLRGACEQGKAWRLKGFENVRISANIAMRQFKDANFVKMVTEILRDTGLPPECLELELTESMVMSDAHNTIKILQDLKELGIRLSIDDFGTGFSSLSYLKSMPIDVVKIDRSFIRDIPMDKDDIAITTAIINMAHSLDIEVVAEGVEKIEQYQLLKSLGCDSIQGFLFMKPSTVQEVEEFVERWQPSDAPQ